MLPPPHRPCLCVLRATTVHTLICAALLLAGADALTAVLVEQPPGFPGLERLALPELDKGQHWRVNEGVACDEASGEVKAIRASLP